MFHFYFQAPSIADWIVIILTFIGVCISGTGLILAFKTIREWKKQKQWDIVLEAFANLKKTENYYYYLLNSFNESFLHSQVRKILHPDETENTFFDSFQTQIKTNDDYRYDRFDNIIFMINEKLRYAFPNGENELKSFYRMISEKITDRELKQNELKNTVELFNSGQLESHGHDEFRDYLIDKLIKLDNYLLNDDEVFQKSIDLIRTTLKKKDIENFIP